MDLPKDESPKQVTEVGDHDLDLIDKELQGILAETESLMKGMKKIFNGIDNSMKKEQNLERMPTKDKLLTLLFVMFFCTLGAQNSVSFNVIETVSTLGVENATVTLNSVSLQTDANGEVTFTNITDGSYTYSVSALCFIDTDGNIMVSGADVIESVSLNNQVTAPVFVSTSSNPIIGAWVDGNINLTDGTNTYNADVTEFDNIIPDVVFGTYDYAFMPAGGCFPSVTGTLTVDCDAIEAQSGNVFFPIVADQPEITTAPVFVSTSSNPIIGAWVDGNINLTDGTNTYNADVTEFDNIIPDVVFGTYNYAFMPAGGCFPSVTGTLTVDCDAIEAQSGNVFFPIVADQPEITTAPVFVSTSSNPIIGAWVDGNINLTDGTNTYNADVTEFDNIIPDVVFGTYDYAFMPAGGCFPSVTGTLTVDCDAIEAQSGNVFFPIVADQPEITTAPVFVSTSSNPIIGAWVDGNINLTDGTNTYNADVTEFDNIIPDVVFGTYDYAFMPAGGCFPSVTGTLTVDCDAIEAQSGNVFFPIVADQPEITTAPVFVSTSSNPIIGAWVDGNINLTDGTNTYNADVTEFDNIIPDVVFGTYDYAFMPTGGCFPSVTGTLTVDCDAIEAQSGNVFFPIVADQPEITTAPVFVSTSSNPIIGAWVDGNINLTDGTNTYNADVTEFDNIIPDVVFGTYDYAFMPAGGCFPSVTGTLTVDCNAIEAQSGNVFFPIVADQPEITTAPVFVSTSSNPIIGAWVDGNINLTDGTNTYNADVTEFDNIIPDVVFGTYDYTFMPAGGCFPSVTGTLTVDCDAIEAQSGNVFFPIVADQPEITTAPVFVSTSSNPIIGAWVDGNINLTDGTNTYNADVTEFDNIIPDVVFGTYNYTFMPAGGCFPSVTGTLTVNCDAIEAQSGNVFFPIVADQPEITIDISVTQEDSLLTANTTGATIGYQWIDCNNGNAEIPGEINQTFISTTSGSFAVIITDSICGKSDTSACFDITPTSSDIGLIENDVQFTVFPNPARETVTITIAKLYPEVRFELYSLAGQLIHTETQLNITNFQVNVSELISGSYVVKLTAESKVRIMLLLKK